MKKTKKAFTVIELVIVIAVIGILSAVLIPTITNLTSKASTATDAQLVRNLNVALATDLDEHPTMHSTLASVKKNGFEIQNINKTSSGNKILWDSKNNLFCYLHSDSGEIEYIPDSSSNMNYPENTSTTYDSNKVNAVDYWIVDNTINEKYSTYLYNYSGSSDITNLKTGLDVGNTDGITNITYNADTTQSVKIRTNGATTLTIDSVGGTIYHYGDTQDVNIIKCDSNSYTENGHVAGTISISQGHLIIPQAQNVNSVNITEKVLETGSSIRIDVSGSINDVTNYITKDASAILAESISINLPGVQEITHGDPEFSLYVKNNSACDLHDLINALSYEELVASYAAENASSILSDWVETSSPTCTTKGAKCIYCTECNALLFMEEIPALGHDLIHHEGHAATCLENGYAAYDTCSRCDYSTYTVIDATGHEWYSPTYTWNGDQCTATRICKHDALHTESETVTGVYHETQSATCTTASQGTLVATFTNPVFESQVTPHNGVNPAEGHTYVFDKIEWGDNHTAKAKYICNKDSNHITKYDCTVTSDITPATCLAEGSATYTATYDIYEDVVHEVLPIDPNAPDASCPTYEWNQMNDTAASYYENVTYDLSNTTSQISSYMSSTSYRKDQPVGQTVDLVAGDLTVTDNGTGNSYTVSVSSGPYTFYNITPGVGGEFVVRRNNVVMQQGHLRPTGSLRMIYSDTLYNIRDLGGWSVDNGAGTIKYNKIFRGGTPLATSENDKDTWVKLTGIDYDLVLREQNGYPTTHSPLGDDIGVNFVTLSTAANEANMENITTARTTGKMGQIANYIFDNTIAGDTTYFHCLAGADRTGMVAIVVEGVLGMSPTDIEKEYELTSFAVDPSTRTRDGIRYHFNAINDYDGKTFRDRCINYLIDCGVTLDKINAFRNAMIEGTAKTITSSDLSCITNLHFNAYTMVGPGNQALEVGSVMHSVTNWGSYTSNPVEIKYGDSYQLFIRCDDGNKAFQNIKVFLYNSTSNAVTEIFTFGNMWKGYTKDITPSDPDSDRLIVQVAITSLTIEEADSSIFLRTLVSDDTQSEITFTVGDVANPSVGGTINMNGSSNNYRCYSNVFDLTSSKKIVIANNTGASVGVLIFYGDSDSKCLVAPSITNISNGSTSEFYLDNANLAKARIKVRDSANPANNPSSFTVYITNR